MLEIEVRDDVLTYNFLNAATILSIINIFLSRNLLYAMLSYPVCIINSVLSSLYFLTPEVSAKVLTNTEPQTIYNQTILYIAIVEFFISLLIYLIDGYNQHVVSWELFDSREFEKENKNKIMLGILYADIRHFFKKIPIKLLYAVLITIGIHTVFPYENNVVNNMTVLAAIIAIIQVLDSYKNQKRNDK